MEHKPIFEIIMLVAFGLAWPFSIRRSWMSRTAEGKSVVFLWIVFFGYVSGVINKIYNDTVGDGAIWIYTCNALMVGFDTALYYRNRYLDRRRGKSLGES